MRFHQLNAGFARSSGRLSLAVSLLAAVLSSSCGVGEGASADLEGDADEDGALTSAGGLAAEYFSGRDFARLVLARTDDKVDFNWGAASPAPQVPADQFSVRWTGFVVPAYSETYTFITQSDDGIRVFVRGQKIIDNWTDHSRAENRGTIALTANVPTSISVEYYENGGDAVARLFWSSPRRSRQIIPRGRLFPASMSSAALLSCGKPVTASSSEDGTLTPEKAVDGTTTTRWASQEGHDPEWIQVDLGSSAAIARVRLVWEVAYAKIYRIETSLDGSSWTTLNVTTDGDGQLDDLAVTGTGRYVRVTGTERGTPYGYSLWELEVYGTDQGGGSSGGDTLPPAAPTDLRVSATTATSVTLAWVASSDDIAVTSYSIYRNGAAITQATGTSFTDAGLAPSTSYRYQVRARDAAGNLSEPSNEATATTAGSTTGLSWAGVRSSSYGTANIGYPTQPGWASAIKTMAGYFPGSSPSASIWLIGEVDYDQKGMILEFPRPNDGKTYGSLYQFSSNDKHEPYFTYFDAQGIQIYPQLEPGDADIPTLIDLVLSRYKHHPSVIGLAIDAEWIHKTSDSGNETPVTDAQASAWEQRVKSYNPSYRLVLKHYEESNLPPTYRGDIVFVCDDEQNGSLSGFLGEMKRFADHFYPSPVMFQIGYPSDKGWWSQVAKPIPQTLGLKLAGQTRQQFGVLWVDFSIDDPAINLIP